MSNVPALRRAVRNCSLVPPGVAYSPARVVRSFGWVPSSVADRPPKTVATYRVASVWGDTPVGEPPADRVEIGQVSGDRGGRRRQRVERILVVDGDDPAERVEDRAGELVPGMDRCEARPPGDGRQRDRAHDDLCRRHQGAESVDRDAGHDADDRLLSAEGQARERDRRVLRSHAQKHDVCPLDNGLVAVDDLDGWVASGEPARPPGASRREVDGGRVLLSFAQAGDDRLGDRADPDDAKVTVHGYSAGAGVWKTASTLLPSGSSTNAAW
jgi:hypothetical protein